MLLLSEQNRTPSGAGLLCIGCPAPVPARPPSGRGRPRGALQARPARRSPSSSSSSSSAPARPRLPACSVREARIAAGQRFSASGSGTMRRRAAPPSPPARRRLLLLGLGLLLGGAAAAAAAAGGGLGERLQQQRHYDSEGAHLPDYDREALLGGQEEVEEFAKLDPDEQLRRLKSIFKRIDIDADGFLTEDELSLWIQQSFKHYVVEDAKQQFGEYDKDGDGHVSWEEYNIQMYDRIIDFEEDTTLEDTEEESFRQLHLKDKKRFEKANKDGTFGLNLDEFIAFEHPEEAEYMKEFVIQEALEEHDKNGDGFVSLKEFLGDYRRDPTASDDPEWILVEKDRFANDYDKDKDGKLNPKELLSWVVPNNEGIAQEEAVHLIKEMDVDGNKKLSVAEVLENQDLFLNSEATDYGRQLHDASFYHEEL
ncbi:reticulocalbin-2 isoform X1 [Hemicordylus capensis]|uniref:reticulocalbin-2 isoform X1 n=1 Tax=Hemicordylus capensis TaxID=884348 RepID=UPI0023029ADE|nr:reticulocalbin-2 isoform X1 [Hemicordylus capensis]